MVAPLIFIYLHFAVRTFLCRNFYLLLSFPLIIRLNFHIWVQGWWLVWILHQLLLLQNRLLNHIRHLYGLGLQILIVIGNLGLLLIKEINSFHHHEIFPFQLLTLIILVFLDFWYLVSLLPVVVELPLSSCFQDCERIVRKLSVALHHLGPGQHHPRVLLNQSREVGKLLMSWLQKIEPWVPGLLLR